ncbi:hypothetical protein KHP62_05430 [Rhodobacteraceae bacterium NNCM2]|nr:hypothetical protein [Coraliihabitans acroporae]
MAYQAGLPLFFGSGDFYLHVQMLSYYAVAFGLGLALGYLIWGWGRAANGAADKVKDASDTAEEEGKPPADHKG